MSSYMKNLSVLKSFSGVGEHFARGSGSLIEHMARDAFKMIKQRGPTGLFGVWPQTKGFTFSPPTWLKPLADSTQKTRKRLGYTPNKPLLRSAGSNSLRGRIVMEMDSSRRSAIIGSPDKVMLFQEVGTRRGPHPQPADSASGRYGFYIPPRPIFHQVVMILGKKWETDKSVYSAIIKKG